MTQIQEDTSNCQVIQVARSVLMKYKCKFALVRLLQMAVGGSFL